MVKQPWRVWLKSVDTQPHQSTTKRQHLFHGIYWTCKNVRRSKNIPAHAIYWLTFWYDVSILRFGNITQEFVRGLVAFNPLWPCDPIRCHTSVSFLVPVISRRLFCLKPLPQSAADLLLIWLLSNKIRWNVYQTMKISFNEMHSKGHLQNVGHFC